MRLKRFVPAVLTLWLVGCATPAPHRAPLRVTTNALLTQRAPELPPDALGGEAIRLAEHLWLGHLADPAGLETLQTWILQRKLRRS